MYHYYVRYSVFVGNEKIGDGISEAIRAKEISEISQIKQLAEELKEGVGNTYNCEVDSIIIDFYQLLRKDPD